MMGKGRRGERLVSVSATINLAGQGPPSAPTNEHQSKAVIFGVAADQLPLYHFRPTWPPSFMQE